MFLRRILRCSVFIVFLFQSVVAFAADFQREIFPLERNSIKLHMERYQSDDTGEKKQILLVHGLTYSSHEFDVNYEDYSLARFLTQNGYTVWLLDVAGYGKSQQVEDGFSINSDYAVEDIAAAAKFILENTKKEKLDVLGWSWGTVIGGRLAAKYPSFVNKLVLYAPIIAGRGKADVTQPFNQNTWAHAASDFQVKVDKSIDYDIIERPVADTFLSNCWRYDGNSSPNGGRRDLRVDASERLISVKDIKAPTFLIVGSNDYVFNAVIEESLKALPSGSELKVVEGAAHAMMMEKPYYKIFRESVLQFLSK
jgi:pimeloyl-ACP methyl ester carboxylesterase